MAKKVEKVGTAVLTLTITYQHARILEVIESAREVIEKASEQGAVEGNLVLNRSDSIAVDELRG